VRTVVPGAPLLIDLFPLRDHDRVTAFPGSIDPLELTRSRHV
jgi:hypothetical protein